MTEETKTFESSSTQTVEQKTLDNSPKPASVSGKGLDPVFNRERRRPRSVDGYQLKLAVDERFKKPGYTYRWVKGTPQRLEQMLALDWEFVTDPELAKDKGATDTRVSVFVGALENGNPRRDYLMYIPKKWYDIYQKEKLARLDEVEEQIKNGHLRGISKSPLGTIDREDAHHMYVPQFQQNTIKRGS